AYTLMTGTTDPQVWADARALLARLIELYADHPDGKADDAAKQAAEIAILQWARPQERPLLIGRTANWTWGKMRGWAQGIELSVDSPTARFSSPLKLSLPVAGCDRREGRFSFDGKLDDWSEIDLIHDGPLVKMLSRPAVLAQTLEQASTTTKLYTNFAADNF